MGTPRSGCGNHRTRPHRRSVRRSRNLRAERDPRPQLHGLRIIECSALGPAAITGIHPNAIVRVDPAPGATGVEDNFLPLLELARPDLPWLFTPAKPNAANRLRPWLVLIVVDAAGIQVQPGTPLPRITVNDSQLPDLNDSWAWAHAQVTVDDPATAAQALNPSSGIGAITRQLCPRRLQKDTAYLACLVPSTLAGVQAGLGFPIDPGPSMPLAWTAGAGQDVRSSHRRHNLRSAPLATKLRKLPGSHSRSILPMPIRRRLSCLPSHPTCRAVGRLISCSTL